MNLTSLIFFFKFENFLKMNGKLKNIISREGNFILILFNIFSCSKINFFNSGKLIFSY